MKPVLRRMDAATYVKDIETSRAFYELLGFYELQSGRGPASAWSAMRNGRDTVLLTWTRPPLPVPQFPLLFYFFFGDLDALLSALDDAGLKPVHLGHPVMQQLAQPIKESGQGAVPIVISVRGAVLTGALIAEQTCFSEPRRGESLMRALEPSSGLLGKEYAQDAEAASGRHLHMRAAGPRAGGEVIEALWRISLEAVDGWTLRAGAEDDRGRSPGCSATRSAAWHGPTVGVPCG